MYSILKTSNTVFGYNNYINKKIRKKMKTHGKYKPILKKLFIIQTYNISKQILKLIEDENGMFDQKLYCLILDHSMKKYT